MNWLSRIRAARGGQQALNAEAVEALEHWQALAEPAHAQPFFETRYVVLNTEATGLDLDRDRLLAVGAIGVDSGLIHLVDAYYAALEPSPGEALAGLLGFAGRCPLVVFNANFNRNMLERALARHLGLAADFVWVDLYFLLPSLFPERLERPGRLADWMAAFEIETFQRHHALGDAWAIAQLFLAAQSRALALGVTNPKALAEHAQAYRQKLKI
ncbi:MAG: 3'-5' exonuclease [Thauera sp.]|jgi:DNA polymerase-3 subunit epsilon